MNASLPKEPLELVFKKTPDKPVGFACPCGVLFTTAMFGGGEGGKLAAQESAAAHCMPRPCACGQAVERKHYTKCNACLHDVEAKKEQARFEKAKKVTIEEYEHDAVFWDDGPTGDIGEGYWSSIEVLLDRCEEDEIDPPDYVWGVSSFGIELSARHIIESALSGHHEDAYDELDGNAEKELQELLDGWAKKQDVTSFEADYSTAVLLRPSE